MKYYNRLTKTLIHCPRCKWEHFSDFDTKTEGLFSAVCDKCELVIPISALKVRKGMIELVGTPI